MRTLGCAFGSNARTWLTDWLVEMLNVGNGYITKEGRQNGMRITRESTRQNRGEKREERERREARGE